MLSQNLFLPLFALSYAFTFVFSQPLGDRQKPPDILVTNPTSIPEHGEAIHPFKTKEECDCLQGTWREYTKQEKDAMTADQRERLGDDPDGPGTHKVRGVCTTRIVDDWERIGTPRLAGDPLISHPDASTHSPTNSFRETDRTSVCSGAPLLHPDGGPPKKNSFKAFLKTITPKWNKNPKGFQG